MSFKVSDEVKKQSMPEALDEIERVAAELKLDVEVVTPVNIQAYSPLIAKLSGTPFFAIGLVKISQWAFPVTAHAQEFFSSPQGTYQERLEKYVKGKVPPEQQ